MTTPSSQPSIADEVVSYLQHDLPGLEDGSYELDISQHVDDQDGTAISGDTIKRRYRFAITGDRFRFSDPSATVASVFPADNATGEYGAVLPHVVLSSTSLPWMRAPTTAPPKLPPPGTDTESDVPTWLAVLLLDADDPVAELTPVTRTYGDLFPPKAFPASTLGSAHSYFDGATTTAALEIDETTADPVQTIDLPLALFTQIAPTLDDLSLSAHVRRVAVENKPVGLGSAPATDPIGAFSVVVGNRVPQRQQRSHAYLVSLEGLAGLLPTATSGTGPAPTGTIRLAVLQYWTFNSTGDTAAFVDQLERLNGRTPGGPDAAVTTLRLEQPAATPPISGALAAGYVPLAEQLRTGEQTVSWYRGPLSPVDAAPTPITLPISSPDQAMIFDPTTGLLDVSLAAAWTIGRLAALQDQSFSAALYGWKQGLTRSVADAAEQQLLDEAMAGGSLPPAAPTNAAAPTHGPSLLHRMVQLVHHRETER